MKPSRLNKSGSWRSRKTLIVANWKMNPESEPAAFRLISAYKLSASTDLVVCAPAVFLSRLIARFGKKMDFGGQDCLWQSQGPHTGENSPASLKALGAKYVILGHSERRKYQGENDEVVNKKVLAAIAEKLSPVICLGGGLGPRSSKAKIKSVLRRQFTRALKGVKSAKKLILVFEPTYAISTFSGGQVGAFEAAAFARFLRQLTFNRFGPLAAANTPILYGGNVRGDSAPELLRPGQLDGLLVGAASLQPKDFNRILQLRMTPRG